MMFYHAFNASTLKLAARELAMTTSLR